MRVRQSESSFQLNWHRQDQATEHVQFCFVWWQPNWRLQCKNKKRNSITTQPHSQRRHTSALLHGLLKKSRGQWPPHLSTWMQVTEGQHQLNGSTNGNQCWDEIFKKTPSWLGPHPCRQVWLPAFFASQICVSVRWSRKTTKQHNRSSSTEVKQATAVTYFDFFKKQTTNVISKLAERRNVSGRIFVTSEFLRCLCAANWKSPMRRPTVS